MADENLIDKVGGFAADATVDTPDGELGRVEGMFGHHDEAAAQ